MVTSSVIIILFFKVFIMRCPLLIAIVIYDKAIASTLPRLNINFISCLLITNKKEY